MVCFDYDSADIKELVKKHRAKNRKIMDTIEERLVSAYSEEFWSFLKLELKFAESTRMHGVELQKAFNLPPRKIFKVCKPSSK